MGKIYWWCGSLAWVAVACSGEPGLEDCEGADCEAIACEDDSDCAGASYCGADEVCTRTCSADDDCKEGDSCGADNLCLEAGNGGGGTGGGGFSFGGSGAGDGSGGMGGSDACVDVNVAFEPVIPTIVLLIDRSSSMSSTGFGDTSRWSSISDALVGASGDPTDDGIVGEFADEVRFGVTLYAADRSLDWKTQCPLLVQDAPSLGNLSDVKSALANAPVGGTPTGASFNIASAALAADPHEGPKVIVLATDGDPDRCDPKQSSTSPAIKTEVVDNVEAAYQDENITTFVINVGGTVDLEHLREVANVGQGIAREDKTGRYFNTNNGAELESAFRSIIDGNRSCVVELDGKIPAGQEGKGTISLDGKALKLNGPDGWRVNNASELELVGNACETLKSGDRELSIVFPCNVIEPIVR